MPGKKEDLRHAEAGADPALTFGYNELVEELKREYDCSLREEGDVRAREMAEVTNLTERQWQNILETKARAGELVKVRVKDAGSACSYFVYRKKK